MTRLASRVAVSLQVNQAADPLPRNTSTNHDVDEQQAPTNGCSNENEMRTKAPLNVKNWQEALSIAGDSMWKEIQEKFQVNDANHLAKMYTFVVDTMQRLYWLWKCRLHYYYKSAKCGKTNAERLNNPPLDLPKEQWQWCVEHYGSDEFKTKENDGVKPTADVIWLVQHTHTNKEDKLEWADGTRSKIIHEKLKNVVATVGDSMTQEEILIQVLEPRSGYVRGKGTALRGYSKGKQQLEQRRLVEQQQQKIQEQEQRIKELEESHQKQQQELEDCKQRQQQELEEHKAQQQQAMEDFKRELLQQLANRGI
uniref:Uncharacterized protein n=1 Tax=Chenopodium quinoa TaxID=63459 RepID=A0A803N8V6_CHEQI